MKLSFEEIIPYRNGKAGIITGLCEQIGLDKIFDDFLTSHTGRPPGISYGHLAEMMLVTMVDEHHPLYRMKDYLCVIPLPGSFSEVREIMILKRSERNKCRN